jgi:hypothetical protein
MSWSLYPPIELESNDLEKYKVDVSLEKIGKFSS